MRRVAFVAVADDVLRRMLGVLDSFPFDVRWKPGTATTAEAAFADLVDDLLWTEFGDALPQCGKAVVTKVLVQVEWIDSSAELGGNVFLRT